MDFGIGYRWRTHESNLLLSVRLPDDGSGAAGRDVIGRAAAAAGAAALRKPRPPAPIAPQPRRLLLFWR